MFTGKYRSRNIAFIAIVLLAATAYYFFFSQPAAGLQFSAGDGLVTFTGTQGESCTFALAQVTELTLVEAPDYGVAAGGGTAWPGKLYGTWQSDTLGSYQAFASSRIALCILVRDGEKTAVFNIENADTTRAVYDQLAAFRQAAA